MHIFTLEHSKTAHRADMAIYGIIEAGLAAYLVAGAPHGLRAELAALAAAGLAAAGLASWTAIEYAMHRFLLHRVQPFKSWHEEHHQRPKAIIFTPTILSLAWQFFLIFIPALLAVGPWRASALTFGVLAGYLSYTITHHAVHHWPAGSAWLRQRKRWHALHHHRTDQPGCYGVTTAFWDHVFGSAWHAARAKADGRERNVY
jgi:sterol desaturase/sphingolipid hydroxylase (fatty acid hydroxylase superfamily)